MNQKTHKKNLNKIVKVMADHIKKIKEDKPSYGNEGM